MTRPYRQQRRAESQQETRRRIAQAVYDLHSTIGPAATTVTAVAEKAQVDRVTVYRHFPDELSLYEGCLEHWWAARPLPDPERWAEVTDPLKRLRMAVRDLYEHFLAEEGLWTNGWRDIAKLPLLQKADAIVFQTFARMAEVLTMGWAVEEDRAPALYAWIRHALEFPTCQSLIRTNGLSQGEAVDLVVTVAACLSRRRRARDRPK